MECLVSHVGIFQLLLLSFILNVYSSSHVFAQGPPSNYDQWYPPGWENPIYGFTFMGVDIEPNQRPWVKSALEAAKKNMKYHDTLSDIDYETAKARYLWPESHRIYMYFEWENPDTGITEKVRYPPGDPCDALRFEDYDQGCFQDLSGPYSHLPDYDFAYFTSKNKVVHITPRMGREFGPGQRKQVLAVNRERNGGIYRSDMRKELIDKFYKSAFNTGGWMGDDIPEDKWGDPLVKVLNSGNPPDNAAEVDHIIPKSHPLGYGCGKNSFRNALVISRHLNGRILKNNMPTPALLKYMEFLKHWYIPSASVAPSRELVDLQRRVIRFEVLPIEMIPEGAEISELSEEDADMFSEIMKRAVRIGGVSPTRPGGEVYEVPLDWERKQNPPVGLPNSCCVALPPVTHSPHCPCSSSPPTYQCQELTQRGCWSNLGCASPVNGSARSYSQRSQPRMPTRRCRSR